MLSGGDGGDIGSLMVQEDNSTRSSARGFPTRWFSGISDLGHAFKLGNSGVTYILSHQAIAIPGIQGASCLYLWIVRSGRRLR